MNLLRFRPIMRTERLHLPDGSSRLVKVTINDAHSVQHVEDGDIVHATVKPPALRVRVRSAKSGLAGLREAAAEFGGVLRDMGMPKMRQVFSRKVDTGLWAPVPGTEVLR